VHVRLSSRLSPAAGEDYYGDLDLKALRALGL